MTQKIDHFFHKAEVKFPELNNKPVQNIYLDKETSGDTILIKQINIQHKRTASTSYYNELKTTDIMLIQEPYCSNKKLAYIPTSHKSRLPTTKDNINTAILLPNIIDKNTLTLSSVSTNNMTVIKIQKWEDQNNMILGSIYMRKQNNEPIEDIIIKNITGH